LPVDGRLQKIEVAQKVCHARDTAVRNENPPVHFSRSSDCKQLAQVEIKKKKKKQLHLPATSG